MFKFIFILASSFFIWQHVKAQCNVCNRNGVACITESSFNLCFNGQPVPSMTYSCQKEDMMCTNDVPVCMNKKFKGITQGCGDTSNCGKCEKKTDDGKFTCTSRTTYSMCLNGNLSVIRDECPKNKLCDVDFAKKGTYPCVPKCRKPKLCDISVPIDLPTNRAKPTPTTATSTTVSPKTTANPADLFCSRRQKAGRYPLPNNTTCKKFVVCSKRQGTMKGKVRGCNRGRYLLYY